MFVLLEYYLVRVSAMLDQNWRSKGQISSPKWLFMDAESIRKTGKTFNLTATTAILMKLTANMYVDESVNQKALSARNAVFCRNVY